MGPGLGVACGVALGAAAWLASGQPGAVVTVPQRDALRSPRAPRSSDISADGRYVAFESRAALVPADQDTQTDVYVLDRTTGHVTLESDGGPRLEATHARISGDGRYLVFEQRLYRGDEQPQVDIVVRDRATATNRILTRPRGTESRVAWSRSPDISDDGRTVVFSSASTTLVGETDANGIFEDVYAVQLPSGSIRRVSVNGVGVQVADGNSILPAVSADGRWIAFASTAALDLTGPARGAHGPLPRQIYLRDTTLGSTVRVSHPLRGGLPDGDSSLPSISADGNYLAFVSEATNLVDDDRNREPDVFLYDRSTDTISTVSRAADGSSANGASTSPAISADGRFVTYQSDAANLVCARRCAEAVEDINLLWDVFLFDRMGGRTTRVSEDELGGWMDPSAGPSVDGTGRVVTFSSRHPIDAEDRGDDYDLFIRTLPPAPVLTMRRQ